MNNNGIAVACGDTYMNSNCTNVPVMVFFSNTENDDTTILIIA